MKQQDREPGSPQPPADRQDAEAPRSAESSANDSTWGLGSASALDNLRRHEFRVRRSKLADDEGQAPE